MAEKYSIILPVRNGGEYIKACIHSVLAQTCQNFNLIVLENASTDGTPEWIASLHDSRITIYPSIQPLSIEENWQRIVGIPKNKFITLIGHDDLLYPAFLEHIDQLISSYPDAGLYHTHFQFIDAADKLIRNSKAMPAFLTGNQLLQAFLSQQIDSMGTGYVMRSGDYDRVGGISPKYPSLLFADFELWLSLARTKGMAIGSQTDFAFRIHQSTTGKSSDQSLHTALGMYVDYLVSLASSAEDLRATIQQFGSEMLTFYCKGFAHRLLRSTMADRNHLTVKVFIGFVQSLAKTLGVADRFHPDSIATIRYAQIIDSNQLSRKMFRLFKMLHRKPILN